ncbi:hypothetical protein [Ligilactobacillus cholophilus]|uniref:hypothetical protein n=1 Tax=Ligilactobacillus cholophilus TaxID=3050131 RepID=UPI0025AED4B9|nr:hypothetical protein [Ligilactobacillus cholophilus]
MTVDEMINDVLDSENVNKLTFHLCDTNNRHTDLNTHDYLQQMYQLLKNVRSELQTEIKEDDAQSAKDQIDQLDAIDQYLNKYRDFNNYDSKDDDVKHVVIETIKLCNDVDPSHSTNIFPDSIYLESIK